MIKENIKRELILKSVRPYCQKDLIKVLVGQRRVGKSYILKQVQEILISEYDVKEESMIYISKELHEFDNIRNYVDLLEYIEKASDGINGESVSLFIDEIQEIEEFEKGLRDLQARGNFDIYCSGSNSSMLSSDLATLLSGRYIEIDVYPLIYPEFLTFHNLESSKETLMKYLKYGGLPYLIHLDLDDEIIYGYLQSVYNTVILKDVIERFSVRNVDFLHRLVLFLADNVGSILSAKKISDYLKSQKINISVNVVLNYLSHLVAANFIHAVKRIEIQGKKVFEIGEKYYFTDLGLRHAIHQYDNAVDINKVLENSVYNHLKALNYDIAVGQQGSKEIDFVCKKGGELKYIQVTYLLSSDKVIEREFGNLMAINDNYEKYVISADDFSGGDRKGIKHLHIIDFLNNRAF